MKTEQAELDYLRWFYENSDFGPAHEDVVYYMNEMYTTETGRAVPNGYIEEE